MPARSTLTEPGQAAELTTLPPVPPRPAPTDSAGPGATAPRPAKVRARRRTSPPPRLGYRPALDGIRALAVACVFAYHARLPWARAGFLGVDVFFVLSGYLITALLLAERRREGRIDLVRFWARRARRLLPAVVVMLAAVAVVVPVLAPDQSYRIKGDLAAALAYVSNWRLIFGNESYFQAMGRPPVLQHLWSLAVEEQFYLLWPPILAFALRRRPYRRLTRPLLIAAGASTVLMAVLFVPYTDPSRVYYGTDTRAAALLIGSALAAATTRWQLVDSLRRSSRRAIGIAGGIGLAGLAWAVSHVNEFDPRLYRGGFLGIAVLAAAVVAVAARPGKAGPIGLVLGCRPMVWLGQRSYAVYLWFWPVLLLTRAHYDVPLAGTPLLALRIALTLTLATASYRFVERPAREGALGRVWQDVRRSWRPGVPFERSTAAYGLALSTILLCTAIGVAVGKQGTPSLAGVLVNGDGPGSGLNLASPGNGPRGTRNPVEPGLPGTSAGPVATVAVAPTTEPATTTTVTTAPPTTVAAAPANLPTIAAKVTAIGDSVLLGAKPVLESQVDGIVVDASVGRQFAAVLAAVRTFRDGGALGDDVIVQTGNNGPIPPNQFDQMMDALKDVHKVVVVNVKVDRAWQDVNNDVIAQGVAKWPNAHLIDWHGIASQHPEAFYDDGLHLTSSGIRLFAGAVLGALT